MTNVNKPFGFALSRSQNAEYSGVVKACFIPATNSAKLYIGDAVQNSTGSNTTEFMGYKAGSLPIVAKASASSAIDGVIIGFMPNGDTYLTGCLPASTAAVALVIDNPLAKFNIQANGEFTAAMVDKDAKISVSTAGNDYTGISGMSLDVSTVDVDPTLPLHICGIADYLSNDAGNYAVVEVMINHNFAALATKQDKES